ncbi:MAG TPA: MgtC/SapB family protein, partial [Caulobacteraceae bacterium]
HLLVCLASAFLMLMAVQQGEWAARLSVDTIRIDPVRMAHGVLTGIGFLCGGVIFRTGVTVHGLTTAASLWITSALGMLFGVGLYGLAIGATLLVVVVLAALRLLDGVLPQQAVAQLAIRFARDEAPTAPELTRRLKAAGVSSLTFAQRLSDRGETLEFSGGVRGRRWADIEALVEALRADARVLEFELSPRKP